MNRFLLIAVFLLSLVSSPRAQAQLYLAGHLDGVSLPSDDPELSGQFQGGGLGATTGYTFLNFIGPELSYKFLRVEADYTDGSGNKISAQILDRMLSLGARAFVLKLFSIKGGLVFHNFSTNLYVNGDSIQSELNGWDPDVFFGIGGRIPLVLFDIYGDLGLYDADKTAVLDLELGIRFWL